MANKASTKKWHNNQLKKEKVYETQSEIKKKVQLELERDLLRLFKNSLYCDIKLVVNSSIIFTHSCILQTRACKFYNYIYTEYEVLRQNGISIFNFCNVSFTYLQAFIQNVYTNLHTTKAEDIIIRHLQELKSDLLVKHSAQRVKKFSSNQISPDSDLFFTPKCSPSELQKPFISPELKINESNVVSYYKIVSVDDIPVDDSKLEETNIQNKKTTEGKLSEREFHQQGELFEQELAEQDELSSSFQTIFLKENKTKQILFPHSISSHSTKKNKLKLFKKLDIGSTVNEPQDKIKNKRLLLKPNPVHEVQNQVCKQPATKISQSRLQNFALKTQEKFNDLSTNILSNSDMDVSVAGADSGLDSSSICQPETSPKENTVSESSGVDLTETTINDEISNDETIPVKETGSSESSFSLEVETLEANCGFQYVTFATERPLDPTTREKMGENEKECADEFENKENLNEDEINRLDEMEKNMKECETFLYMERRDSLLNHLPPSHSLKSEINNTSATSGDSSYKQLYENTNKVEAVIHSNTNENSEFSLKVNDTLCKNDVVQINNVEKNQDEKLNIWKNIEISFRDNDDLDRKSSSKVDEDHYDIAFSSESNADNSVEDLETLVNSKKNEYKAETKTPPCTPKKLKIEKSVDNGMRENEIKPCTVESNYTGSISNYFIDASSLLDEDEIVTPPISLISGKSVQCTKKEDSGSQEEQKESTMSKTVVSNFFHPQLTDNNSILRLQEDERRQGDIIFKNSIPQYSKHEVEPSAIMAAETNVIYQNDLEAPEEEQRKVVYSPFLLSDSHQSKPNIQSEVVTSESNISLQTDINNPSSMFSEFGMQNHIIDKPAENIKKAELELSQNINNNSVKDDCHSAKTYPVLTFEASNDSESGEMKLLETKKDTNFSSVRSQGEAWVVTFNNTNVNKKMENNGYKSCESTNLEIENSEQDFNKHTQINEPPLEFFIDWRDANKNKERITERKVFPVEKSSSFGYFLDFGKEQSRTEENVEKPNSKIEKKNIFSMFIGIDDNEKTKSLVRKPKRILENEKSYNKNSEENHRKSPSSNCEVAESPHDSIKKPLYMFIESDTSNTKRTQAAKKFISTENNKPWKSQCYSGNHFPEKEVSVNHDKKIDLDWSNSNLQHRENNFKLNDPKSLMPLHKYQKTNNRMHQISACVETKVPNDESNPPEISLRTKDNFEEHSDKITDNNYELPTKKEATFVMREHKASDDKNHVENSNKHRVNSNLLETNLNCTENRNNECFVKLSDMDNSSNSKKLESHEWMSQSASSMGARKDLADEDHSLSRSADCDQGNGTSNLQDIKVSPSLSRLFPNLSSHSLASLSRRDGDIEKSSEHSRVGSSIHSSIEPSPFDVSTSETDVSAPIGGTSRLGEDLLKMFLQEIAPDVTVEVSGRRIKAHKCILSSRCQYFAAMLSGGWVESAGNVISLQGFSYNAVHFALRYIYSGESQIPESLNIVELATLADMLCLDGLQEIISYNLKVKYCHSFHVPCSTCSIGVVDCLPIAAAYGLDDLYRKCLRWITKYFVKLWPTKSFGSLPKELLEKCYQHYVVHMTVDNVLDAIVNIDKVRGSLPNVRWAEPVSRLIKKLHDANIKYIAEHFSAVLTSDNFLALGKETSWNINRLEDSLIEAIGYLPPEEACWSHARLHRILSVAVRPDSPPEMDWNENFLKFLQIIAELVENSLIKQAPRAAKSKAWRQMEPELRSRIQEAACLVLPDDGPGPTYRRSSYAKKDSHQTNTNQYTKARNFEIRQIKLAMSQQANRNSNASRPLSLQIDQRPKKDTRFVPLRPSASTSSVRRLEPVEGIKKTLNKSQIIGSTISEPKKIVNVKYSEVKSRYLEPKSPQKSAPIKSTVNSNQRRNIKYISSSDSSRNCSPSLRSANSRTLTAHTERTVASQRHSREGFLPSNCTTRLDNKHDKRFDMSSARMNRLTKEENMSTDSLCTDSQQSDKETPSKRRSEASDYVTKNKENLIGKRKAGSSVGVEKSKSATNSPTMRRLNFKNKFSETDSNNGVQKFILNSGVPSRDDKSNLSKKLTSGKIPRNQARGESCKSNASSMSSPRTLSNRNQRNFQKSDPNTLNGNSNRKKSYLDADNNKKIVKEESSTPSALSRSGTFLKDEPTILKKPQVDSTNGRV